MEIFSSLLTVSLLTWFFYVCKSPRGQTYPEAGRLVLRLARARSFRSLLRLAIWNGLLLVLLTLCLVFVLDDPFPGGVTISYVSNVVFASPSLASLLRGVRQGVEIREAGLVATSGWQRGFVPWKEVKYCKWKSGGRILFVQLKRGNWDYRVEEDQVAVANAMLPRYVELRDENGVSIPPSPCLPELPPELPEPALRRFQFDLKTLLLLTLVVASASGWIGVRVNRAREQRARIERQKAELDAIAGLQAQVGYSGWQVNGLDFSRSTSPPDDKTIAAVRAFPGLQHLDLAGAPVGDVGLASLAEVTGLSTLSLSRARSPRPERSL